MKISKLLKGLGNIGQIAEGIKNNVFKQEHIEQIADYRWQQCKTCPFLDTKGDQCAVKGTQPCCGECGCALDFKLRSLSSDCPLKGSAKRWDKVVKNFETEKMISDRLEKHGYYKGDK